METLILWLCRLVLITITKNNDQFCTTAEQKLLCQSICNIARDIHRKYYFERFEINFQSKPLSIAKDLLHIIQFYLETCVNLYIPQKLWSKLKLFLNEIRSHQHQQLAELFQHNIINIYPPIIETNNNAKVAQFEETVYIGSQSKIILSKNDIS